MTTPFTRSAFRQLTAIALTILVWCAGAAPALAQDRDSGDSGQSSGRKRLILRHRPGAAERLAQRLAGHEDRVRRRLTGIDAIAVDVHAEDADNLARDPDVLGVSPDAIVTVDSHKSSSGGNKGSSGNKGSGGKRGSRGNKGSGETEIELRSFLDTLTLRKMLGVHASLTGKGVGVAVVDSGVASTVDLYGRVVAFYDFTDAASPTPSDEYGHGTHIAGLIAGSGKSS